MAGICRIQRWLFARTSRSKGDVYIFHFFFLLLCLAHIIHLDRQMYVSSYPQAWLDMSQNCQPNIGDNIEGAPSSFHSPYYPSIVSSSEEANRTANVTAYFLYAGDYVQNTDGSVYRRQIQLTEKRTSITVDSTNPAIGTVYNTTNATYITHAGVLVDSFVVASPNDYYLVIAFDNAVDSPPPSLLVSASTGKIEGGYHDRLGCSSVVALSANHSYDYSDHSANYSYINSEVSFTPSSPSSQTPPDVIQATAALASASSLFVLKWRPALQTTQLSVLFTITSAYSVASPLIQRTIRVPVDTLSTQFSVATGTYMHAPP